MDIVLGLEHENRDDEEQKHQVFVDAFNATILACSPELQGTLLYPLEIITSDVPFSVILGMTTIVQF